MKVRITITAITIALCMVLFACGGNAKQPQKEVKKPNAAQPAKKVEPKLPTINIYRYGDFSVDKAKQLKAELEKVYPSVTLADDAIVLPKECYYKPRDRYKGTGLLDDLMKYRKGGYVLGLTNEIIYQENEISPTFGIFGISDLRDRVSVISCWEPKPHRLLTDSEMRELMLHELGHAFGLDHCKDQHCIMVDAEHGNKFSQTQAFCDNCTRFLKSKGWKL